jgi:hypothetical protein
LSLFRSQAVQVFLLGITGRLGQDRLMALAASASPNTVESASRQGHTPPGFDPLANLEAQERKGVGLGNTRQVFPI